MCSVFQTTQRENLNYCRRLTLNELTQSSILLGFSQKLWVHCYRFVRWVELWITVATGSLCTVTHSAYRSMRGICEQHPCCRRTRNPTDFGSLFDELIFHRFKILSRLRIVIVPTDIKPVIFTRVSLHFLPLLKKNLNQIRKIKFFVRLDVP